MKILLPLKRVIDPYQPVRIAEDGRDVVRDQLPHTLNPFDAAALAHAARWRSEGTASELVVFAIGPERTADMLRSALAMGADKAIHVTATDNAPPSPFTAAVVANTLIAELQPDLVMLGKQASDDDTHETPALIAAFARLPLLPDVYEITLAAGRIVGRLDLNGAPTQAAAPLPCIVSCDLHLAEPGQIGLAQMMQAKRKPIETRPLELFDRGAPDAPIRIDLAAPALRPPCRFLASIDELVELLLAERGPS